jgi:asparagine synthase (glutamine-hydrolysing)
LCGFVSLLRNNSLTESNEQIEIIKAMASAIKHRGPDQEGYYNDDNMYLGFRRLSIIDIENGSQPFPYDNGRYHMVFNGEIYNHVELREDLKKQGLTFTTHSDTEVILALYKQYGSDCVNYLRGMFAFVIWDEQEKKMFGARDHFGIKPFYYYETEDNLYCASEEKSLLFTEDFNPEIDIESLQHYLTFQFVPEPKTILNNVLILEPGCTIQKELGKKAEINRYWSVNFTPGQKPMDKKVAEIRSAIEDSVKIHMRSDVPVGAFLSGGIDSTIIVALASKINPKIKTFTVGFEREGYSEIDLAKETADALGVENISKVITAEEYMENLPKIIWHMDEPMADPAAIPLYFVAREARKYVTVVLSGEGSDELFGGYNIYREPLSLKMFNNMPKGLKKGLKGASSILHEGVKGKSFIERGCTPIENRYVGNARIFKEAEKKDILKHYDENIRHELITAKYFDYASNYDDTTKMQYIDINTWLKGDILVKADRMTMAHSLELRVPFLDKEVFKAASDLSLEQKIGNNTTKYALREAFKDILPASVTTRKKLGFPVPIRHWLKNEMHDWAVDIIKNSETDEYLNKENVLKMLEDHCSGKIDYSRRIWTCLIFMIWHQVFIENKYSYADMPNHECIQDEVALMK